MARKILMATHQYGEGGVGIVSKALHEKLVGQGQEVDVLIKKWNEPYKLLKGDGTTITSNSFSELEQKTRFDYDLCHVHSINFSWAGALQIVRNNHPEIPIFYTAHSIVRHQKEVYMREGQFPNWIGEDISAQDHVMSIADKVQLLTNEGLKISKKHYPANDYKVIPNGLTPIEASIDPSELRRMYRHMDDILFYIGRLSAAKGVRELIKSFPRIHEYNREKTGKRMGLIVMGPEQDIKKDELIMMLPPELRKYVDFTGEKPRSEAAAYYKIANWHILPTKHESFPGVALEAMANGVPSIVSKVDGLKELITDKVNGLHINPEDLEQGIFESVKYAIDYPKELQKLAERAKEEVQKYDWGDIAMQVRSAYEEIIEKRKRLPYLQPRHGIIPQNTRIGVVGHFAYSNGIIPDGVANWCEGAVHYLRDKGFDVKGIGVVGSSRGKEGIEIVELHSLKDAIKNSGVDVVLARGSAEVGRTALDACSEQSINSVWIQPFWGLWQGVYDLVKKADATIVPTLEYGEALAAHTGKQFTKDVIAAPFPIQVEKWPLDKRTSDDRLKVSYAGRIKKDVHKIILAFARAAEEFEEAVLHIRGKEGLDAHKEEELIAKLVKEYSLKDKVMRENRELSSKEMYETFATSAACLFPTSESYGQSNLEAILAGVPVVTYRPIPFNPDNYRCPSMSWLPDYPFMALDDEELAQRLIEILENPAKARERVKCFSEQVRRDHCWAAQGNRLLTAIAQALM